MAFFSKKHLAHCFLYFSVIGVVQYFINSVKDYKFTLFSIEEASSYLRWAGIITLSALNFVVLLIKLLHVVNTSAGLLMYECFSNGVKLETTVEGLPLLSIRVVTHGDYSELVKKNIILNKEACTTVGLNNYVIEIVTEKHIADIDGASKVKQIVVPATYDTKRGTLFKGRNLQYCLEDGISSLSDEDWIVHLDEDSVLTPDAVRGIVNFIGKDIYQLGSGIIHYDKENQSSMLTKILMSHRMSFDYGFQRFSTINNRPSKVLVKGSFIVCKNSVEKDVSFDGGLYSSVSEFFYFTMKTDTKGYKIGWVEGQMEEMGVLSVGEFIKQHTRAYYGMILLKNCPYLDSKNISFINFMCHGSLLLLLPYFPLILINIFFRLPFFSHVSDVLTGLALSYDIYIVLFTVLKMRNMSKFKLVLVSIAAFFFGFTLVPIFMLICLLKAYQKNDINFEITKKEV